MMLGLRSGYVSRAARNAGRPTDFGKARMAASAAVTVGPAEGDQEDWLGRPAVASARPGRRTTSGPRPTGTTCSSSARTRPPSTRRPATLARRAPTTRRPLGLPDSRLSSRDRRSPRRRRRARPDRRGATDPPLPAAELDQVLASYRKLRQSQLGVGAAMVGSDHRRAKAGGPGPGRRRLYREQIAAAVDATSIATAAWTSRADRGDVDALLKPSMPAERIRGERPAAIAQSAYVASSSGVYITSPVSAMARSDARRADTKAHGDILRLLDRYLASLREPPIAKPAAPGTAPRRARGNPAGDDCRSRSGCRAKVPRKSADRLPDGGRVPRHSRRSSCCGTPSSSTAATTW